MSSTAGIPPFNLEWIVLWQWFGDRDAWNQRLWMSLQTAWNIPGPSFFSESGWLVKSTLRVKPVLSFSLMFLFFCFLPFLLWGWAVTSKAIVFFFLFSSSNFVRYLGGTWHPHEDLAKFGYRSGRKVGTFWNSAIYWRYAKNLWSIYGDF